SYSDELRRKLYPKADRALHDKHGHRIAPSLILTKDSPGLAACRARISVAHDRQNIRAELRKRFEGLGVLFLLPTQDAGGGGNVVLTEARALRRAGINAVVANLKRNRVDFEASYPHLDLPVRYIEDDLAGFAEQTTPFDAVIATIYSTVDWLKRMTG